jgi:hypothetical protein
MMRVTETPAQSGRASTPTKLFSIRAALRFSGRFASAKENIMPVPAILQGDSLTRLLQGAAAGAIATLIVGFYWGGWVTGGTARDMVQRSSTAAVVAALSPICVDKFQQSAGAAVNLVELKKISSYQQSSFIEKGGWATLPGNTTANSSVAQACADMLNGLK